MSCLCWEEILEVLLENFKEDEVPKLTKKEKMRIIKQREYLRRKADPIAYRKYRDAENERRRKAKERKKNETTANV